MIRLHGTCLVRPHRFRDSSRFGFSVLVAYIVVARLGLRLAFVAEQVTTVWAPTGIAEAALLLWGRSLWPSIWVAAFVTNVGTNIPVWGAVAIATGNTFEALVAASLLQRLSNFDPALRRVRDALAFVVVAGLLGPAISATIGSLTLCAASVQPWSRLFVLWPDWWLGDTVGALVVAPALLTTFRWQEEHRCACASRALPSYSGVS